MLGAVLDPFHRAAGDLRGERRQHHIGEHRELDAEAAAGVGRDAQPHLRPGHAQRLRHHRMRRERPLEIGQTIVAAVGRVVARDADVAFHRRERQPMEVHRQLDDLVGLLERALGVAVVEFANRDFVGLGFLVQEHGRFLARFERVDHGLARRIFDRDQLGGVLGEIAALGHHQRHRLADIAHAADRERPLVDLRLQRHQERIGDFPDILAGEHRPDAVHGERRRCVDLHDIGVRMRRADHVGCQRAGRHRQIVGIAPAPRQQCRVFLAQRRACRDAVTLNSPQYASWLPSACLSAVTRGLDPRIPLRKVRCVPKRDGRDIGERSDAVLQTAMPGHDRITHR